MINVITNEEVLRYWLNCTCKVLHHNFLFTLGSIYYATIGCSLSIDDTKQNESLLSHAVPIFLSPFLSFTLNLLLPLSLPFSYSPTQSQCLNQIFLIKKIKVSFHNFRDLKKGRKKSLWCSTLSKRERNLFFLWLTFNGLFISPEKSKTSFGDNPVYYPELKER